MSLLTADGFAEYSLGVRGGRGTAPIAALGLG